MTPTPDQIAGAIGKTLGIFKDLPAWLLSGVACAAAILLLVPWVTGQLPPEIRPYLPYLWVVIVVFGCLALFRWLAVGIETWQGWRASRRPRKTFHITAISGQWHSARQMDGSTVVQIIAELLIKSQNDEPVGIAQLRIIRPRRLRGEVVQADVMVRSPRGNMYGTAFVSGHRIPTGMSLPAQAHAMIRCRPPRAREKDLPIQLALVDEDGNEQRIWITCKGRPAPKRNQPIPVESIHAIEDPIAKDIAAILQAEVARYNKNGRTTGGFGSLYLTKSGTPINGFGQDSWAVNSPSNQEISTEPAKNQLHSDNLDAMLKVHGRLTQRDEQLRCLAALRARLGHPSYARVSYFIICVLWRLGDLETALSVAATKLPQEDTEEFALGNTVYLFNGLLRYLHPNFSEADLDSIEKLVDRVGSKDFHIRQKIAAIRAWRVHSGMDRVTAADKLHN